MAHLRRFNQNHQWDVRQVLPIGGFFMSAVHLHHSDKKLGCGATERCNESDESDESDENDKLKSLTIFYAFLLVRLSVYLFVCLSPHLHHSYKKLSTTYSHFFCRAL